MAESFEIEAVFTGDTSAVDAQVKRLESRKPKIQVQMETEGTFAGERLRNPATGRLVSSRGGSGALDLPPTTPTTYSGSFSPISISEPEMARQVLHTQSIERQSIYQQNQAGRPTVLSAAYSDMFQEAVRAGDRARQSRLASEASGYGIQLTPPVDPSLTQSADVRRQMVREYQSTPGIRTGSDPLSAAGDPSLRRSGGQIREPKLEAAINELVDSIQRDARAHDEAAAETLRNARESDRNRREVGRAQRAWRRATEAEETDRSRDFTELDRRAGAYARSRLRDEGRAFQAGIRGFSRRTQLQAIEERMGQLGDMGPGGPPPEPGDAGFPEWDRLNQQRAGLQNDPGRKFGMRRLWFQAMFGAWELSREATVLGRGQREAGIALTPLESLETQNAAIRAAGGGIFGGIATELLNLSPLKNSPARIEEATFTEKARRADLDYVRTTQLTIATQSGQRNAMLTQGGAAARIAGIQGKLGQEQFELNQQIGDWKAQIGATTTDLNWNALISPLPGDSLWITRSTLDPAQQAERRQRIAAAQKLGKEQQEQAAFEIRRVQTLDQIEQGEVIAQGAAVQGILGGGSARAINQPLRRQMATFDIQKYAEDHGGQASNATVRYANWRYGQADLENAQEDARYIGADIATQGTRISLGLHRRNMGFEAGLAGIAGDISSKYAASALDPETQANILTAGTAQIRDYVGTAFRAATNRNRTNYAAGRADRLKAQGLTAEANEVAINEAEAQQLDEAGSGVFASLFLRPAIRYRAAQSRIVNKYEDSRATGLELQGLHNQVTIARLESEGRPGTAQVETVRLQALQEVAALRGDDHFQERRKTILQRASFQEKALQRQFMNEIFAGSVEQTVGGTFAPGVGFNYPWEEDRQRKIAAADAAGRDLEDQSNKPGTPPQVGGPDLNDIYNLLQGDLKNAIIGIWQAITQG
jgi:hypothetical protein